MIVIVASSIWCCKAFHFSLWKKCKWVCGKWSLRLLIVQSMSFVFSCTKWNVHLLQPSMILPDQTKCKSINSSLSQLLYKYDNKTYVLQILNEKASLKKTSLSSMGRLRQQSRPRGGVWWGYVPSPSAEMLHSSASSQPVVNMHCYWCETAK